MIKIGTTPVCVVDVETTGLHPSSDRVVEIAVIRLDPTGAVSSAWSTLVDPGCDPGPSIAHGIYKEDLEFAPVFSEVISELGERLDGCIFAAHNVNFDSSFLRYEYMRLGRAWPSHPLLDTGRVASALGRVSKGESRSLRARCAFEGIRISDQHSALGDAMATATLLGRYLDLARMLEWDYEDLAVSPLELPDSDPIYPARTISKAVPRR